MTFQDWVNLLGPDIPAFHIPRTSFPDIPPLTPEQQEEQRSVARGLFAGHSEVYPYTGGSEFPSNSILSGLLTSPGGPSEPYVPFQPAAPNPQSLFAPQITAPDAAGNTYDPFASINLGVQPLADYLTAGTKIYPTPLPTITPRPDPVTAATGTTGAPGATGGTRGDRGDTAPSRTGAPPPPGTGATGTPANVAAILQGLTPQVGASATINGTSYTATPTGWVASSSLPPTTSQGATGQPSSLLGFTPTYQTFDMPTFATDGSGTLTGTRPAAQTYQYADRATADRLAQMLGATVYEEPSTAPNRTAPTELSLVFGNGARHNAGLVARMFETDPANAMRRLQAELNYSPGNAVASTSPAYAAPYTPPSAAALNAGQQALSRAPRINGGNQGYTPVPQASYLGTGSTAAGAAPTGAGTTPNPLAGGGTDFGSFARAQAAARPPRFQPGRSSRTNYYPGFY